jgi:hypothetical protein
MLHFLVVRGLYVTVNLKIHPDDPVVHLTFLHFSLNAGVWFYD